MLLLFGILMVRLMFYEHSVLAGYKTSARFQSSVYSLVFEKIRRVDKRALKYLNVGYLINNITSDVIRLHIFIATARQLANAPIMLVLFTAILVVEVGVYSLAGLGIIVCMIMVNILNGKLLSRFLNLKMALSSLRNREMAFAISGIKSVKFNCWEDVLRAQIRRLKARENRAIWLFNSIYSLSESLNNIIPSLAGFATIVLYNVVREDNLSLERVFFILAVFNTLITPLKQFYFSYSSMEQVRVNLGRVQKLLSLPDSVGYAPDASIPRGSVLFEQLSSSYKARDFDRRVLGILNSNEPESLKRPVSAGRSRVTGRVGLRAGAEPTVGALREGLLDDDRGAGRLGQVLDPQNAAGRNARDRRTRLRQRRALPHSAGELFAERHGPQQHHLRRPLRRGQVRARRQNLRAGARHRQFQGGRVHRDRRKGDQLVGGAEAAHLSRQGPLPGRRYLLDRRLVFGLGRARGQAHLRKCDSGRTAGPRQNRDSHHARAGLLGARAQRGLHGQRHSGLPGPLRASQARQSRILPFHSKRVRLERLRRFRPSPEP